MWTECLRGEGTVALRSWVGGGGLSLNGCFPRLSFFKEPLPMAKQEMGDIIKWEGLAWKQECLPFLRATSIPSLMSGCNDIAYPVGSFVVRINQEVYRQYLEKKGIKYYSKTR